MFLFLSKGKKRIKDHGYAYVMTCNNCRNQSFLKLVHIRTWFTIFFIPLIPYKSEKLLICDICNNVFTLSNKNFKKARILVPYTESYKEQNMSFIEYSRISREMNIFS